VRVKFEFEHSRAAAEGRLLTLPKKFSPSKRRVTELSDARKGERPSTLTTENTTVRAELSTKTENSVESPNTKRKSVLG
jgi:hypothetical protein